MKNSNIKMKEGYSTAYCRSSTKVNQADSSDCQQNSATWYKRPKILSYSTDITVSLRVQYEIKVSQCNWACFKLVTQEKWSKIQL